MRILRWDKNRNFISHILDCNNRSYTNTTMPYLPTAQAWLTQSALLLEARPTTVSTLSLPRSQSLHHPPTDLLPQQTRITTKYTLSKPSLKPRSSKTTKSDPTTTTATDPPPAASETAPPASTTPQPPPPTTRATLTLKTYNPSSGVTLKYKTDKAAEVGRLISSLARLGRTMAGLPEVKEDVAMLDAHAAVEGGAGAEVTSGVATPVPEGAVKSAPVGGGPGPQAGGGPGGKKGKKKGKK